MSFPFAPFPLSQIRRRSVEEGVRHLNKLWILRVLVLLDVGTAQVSKRGFLDRNTLDAIGLPVDVDYSSPTETPQFKHALQEQLVISEAQYRLTPFDLGTLGINLEQLGNLLSLDEAERAVLLLSVLLREDSVLSSVVCAVGEASSISPLECIATVLQCPLEALQPVFNGSGTLMRTGLLSYADSYRDGTSVSDMLRLSTRSMARRLTEPDLQMMDLLHDRILLSTSPILTLQNYLDRSAQITLAQAYLKSKLATKAEGVNVLIHGDPGTGKTQLCKVLAASLGVELFEVVCEDDTGDPITGPERLSAYLSAQKFLQHKPALILFDEIEEVFTVDDKNDQQRRSTQNKGWINRMLETNTVPAFWVTNSVSHMDRAFIRRFDVVIDLPIHGRHSREQALNASVADLASEAAIARLAESSHLSPAIAARAASVVRSIQNQLPNGDTETALLGLISGTLKAQEFPQIKARTKLALPSTYDVAFLNTDVPLDILAKGICKAREGRICLYGPPGTGKTAFGQWLAEQMGAPLLVKRASDILSMYVGGTEKGMAAAFEEAEDLGAVLLMDEVDSFLQNRQHAMRSWEITAVNEMLMQMEAFTGVFVASTNLMDDLDPAALRRFDAKLKFGWLKAEQAWALLQQHCLQMGLAMPADSLRSIVNALTNLAPGDFNVIARRHKFQAFSSAACLVQALDAESRLKNMTSRSGNMGFVPS